MYMYRTNHAQGWCAPDVRTPVPRTVRSVVLVLNNLLSCGWLPALEDRRQRACTTWHEEQTAENRSLACSLARWTVHARRACLVHAPLVHSFCHARVHHAAVRAGCLLDHNGGERRLRRRGRLVFQSHRHAQGIAQILAQTCLLRRGRVLGLAPTHPKTASLFKCV